MVMLCILRAEKGWRRGFRNHQNRKCSTLLAGRLFGYRLHTLREIRMEVDKGRAPKERGVGVHEGQNVGQVSMTCKAVGPAAISTGESPRCRQPTKGEGWSLTLASFIVSVFVS